MDDIDQLPTDLQVKPKGLIVFTGLNTDVDPFHNTIWKAFTQNQRSNRLSLKYVIRPINYNYSKAKVKHSSHYEWYLPKGILKRNWMRKHLEEIPAVCVMFFDLEKNDPNWAEKAKECARCVDLVRSNLMSRATKFVVTLLQKNPNTVGDDISMEERSKELCDQCQISTKNIFVLQQQDFTLSSVNRFESDLFEMAFSYYHNAAKVVKSHRSSLTKSSHHLLLIRQDFKIAFFNEMKQDMNLALKHYRQAYNYLLEVKVPTIHLLEFKVIAGFINFKICQIAFQTHAEDAIAQFNRHISIFRPAVGMPELAFEHEAWIAKQYETFGKLFEEATPANLQASAAKYPGFYFYEAGRHTLNRRATALRLCPQTSTNGSSATSATVTTSPAASPTTTAVDRLSDFYGQRSWRPAGQSMDIIDPVKEREGILALQAREVKVDYSRIAIPLFERASRYFDRGGSVRMRNYPKFYIAEEFFLKGQYASALENYSKIVEDYRHSGWSLLFTTVCHRIFHCAVKLGDSSLMVSSAVELLSDYSTLTPAEKAQVHNLVFSVNQSFPGSQSQSSHIIDVTDLKSCVEVRAQFTKSSYNIDEPVKLMVFFRSTACLPVRFESVEVKLNHEALEDGPIVRETNAASPTSSSSTVCEWSQALELTPDDHMKILVFTLDPNTFGSAVQVESIQAAIAATCPGTDQQLFSLSWFPSAMNLPSRMQILPCNYTTRLNEVKSSIAAAEDAAAFSATSNLVPQWEYFANQLSATILPKASKLEMSLRHTPPLLCNEKYVILCQITNTEGVEINNLTVSAMLAGSAVNDPMTDLSPTSIEVPQRMGSVAVGLSAGRRLSTTSDGLFSQDPVTPSLSPGVDLVCPISVHCPIVAGDRSLRVDAHYTMLSALPTPAVRLTSWSKNGTLSIGGSIPADSSQLGPPVLTRCVQSKRVQLSITQPFEMSSRVLSTKHEAITAVLTGRTFVLEVTLVNCSPWKIDVERSSFNLDPGVRYKGACDSLAETISLDPYESLTEVQALVIPDIPMDRDILALGQYFVQWRRRRPQTSQGPSFPSSSVCSSSFKLHTCQVVSLPYTVELSLPPFGQLYAPFTISYTLQNKTTLPQDLNVKLEPTEKFVFCGVQLASVRLLPNASRKLDFTLLPLFPGYVQLPRFHLWTGSKAEMNADEQAAAVKSTPRIQSLDHLLSPKRQLLNQLQSHIFIMPNRVENAAKT